MEVSLFLFKTIQYSFSIGAQKGKFYVMVVMFEFIYF